MLVAFLKSLRDSLWAYFGNRTAPILEILSDIGRYLSLPFLIISPSLLGLGLYLMIKNRDRSKKHLSIKEIFVKFRKKLPAKITKKNVVKVLLIALGILTFSFIFHLVLLSRVFMSSLPFGIPNHPIERNWVEIAKKELLIVMPNKYEIVEFEYEKPSKENHGCMSLFTVYPKEYSEIEKIYLKSAKLTYCVSIKEARFTSQMVDVKYDPEKNAWSWTDFSDPLGKVGEYYEQTFYGNNLVTVAEEWGGSYDGKLYIVQRGDGLIALSIPLSNRVRCEIYGENGVESVDEDCANFRNSLKMEPDWVPEEIYRNYYMDLIDMFREI